MTTFTPRASRRPRAARRAGAIALLAAVAPLVLASPAAAHGRWFAEHEDGGDWGFFFSPLPLALVAAVVAATVAWRLVAHRLPRPELPFLAPLGRLTPFVPRLLAIHMGVSLLAYSVTGAFLTPSLPLDEVPGGVFAGVVQAAAGIWLISGIRLRPAALAVVLLGPPALLAAGPVALLETTNTLAVALFLAILPPSDGNLGRVEPSQERLRWALFLLRLFVAIALVTLAFSEKFTNPELSRNLLAETPELNVFQLVGIPVPTDVFIAIAAAVEVLFGLLVLSGAMPQVAVLVAAVPFNATLFLFGTTETIGHLPVYGVFLALLVYGSNARTAEAVQWLPRPADVRQGWASLVRAVRGTSLPLLVLGSGDGGTDRARSVGTAARPESVDVTR